MSVTLKEFYELNDRHCEIQRGILDEIEPRYDQITFERINVKKQVMVADRYDIDSVPTLIIEDGEGIIDRLEAVTVEELLDQALDEALSDGTYDDPIENDEGKSFRERVEEIREKRSQEGGGVDTQSPDRSSTSSSEIGSTPGDSSRETNDQDKSFRERVEEIREKRSREGGGVDTQSPDRSATRSSDTGSRTGDYSRGTVVVPRNKHFLQKLEARSRDGQAQLVETVYALIGETYTHPTDLIPLDDNRFYLLSTRAMTSYDVDEMAQAVARSYSFGTAPKVIAKFHTHPGGVPSPSQADQSGARQIYEAFVSAFGSKDFEFFHGIHSLSQHGRKIPPADRQQPRISGDKLVWDDDKFTHKLAVYGPDFQTQKPIVIENSE